MQAVLSGDGPLIDRDGRLQGMNRMRQAQLAALLERARDATGATGVFDHPDATRRLILHVRPLGDAAPRFGASLRCEQFDPEVPDLGGVFGLTESEQQIVRKLVRGQSATDIADDLGISIKTVEAHRANIMEKLNVNTVADLLRLALSNKPQQQ